MSRPFLLQLAHDSISEVLEAKNILDFDAILREYPPLKEAIPMTLKIFVKEELRGYYEDMATKSLLENIITGAKKAAFEDPASTPLRVTEYFDAEIELTLQTPQGIISHRG